MLSPPWTDIRLNPQAIMIYLGSKYGDTCRRLAIKEDKGIAFSLFDLTTS